MMAPWENLMASGALVTPCLMLDTSMR
jgi:hypothetical protein